MKLRLLINFVVAGETVEVDVNNHLPFVLGYERLLDRDQVLLICEEECIHVLDADLLFEEREIVVLVRDESLRVHFDLLLLVALVEL